VAMVASILGIPYFSTTSILCLMGQWGSLSTKKVL